MHFTKMQGLGNDYLYVYGEVPENIRDISVRLSDRHFGAGSDGMIYISPSDKGDFKMRIFNADGSEGTFFYADKMHARQGFEWIHPVHEVLRYTGGGEAQKADGGMRDGVSLLDQCASAANGSVTLESVYASLGLAGEKRTAELMQAIAEQDTAKALTIFSALYSAGKDVSALLGEMCALCRDLLVLRTAPKSGLSMLSGIATEQQALALQSVFSPGELMRVLTETQKTRVSFGKNTDVRVAAELLLMQLCEPSLRLDAQALDARISRVEEQLASGVLVKSAPKASGGDAFDDDRPPFPDDADDPERGSAPPAQTQEQSSAAPQAETPAGFWPALSEKLRAALPATISGFFAVNGPIHPVLQGEVLIMAVDSDFVLNQVKKTPDTEALVREKASAILGKPVSVRFALKNRLSRLGDDPMDALVQFGQQHSDIFTIK